jgi:branched-chain amino acid transport system substrate-binding protein
MKRAPFLMPGLALALATVLTSLPRAAPAADPVEINMIMPLTGPLAFAGKSESDAVRALEDYVNKRGGIRGRPVKFVIADDGTSPQNAVQITTGFVSKKIPVFAGSSLAAMCNAEAPLVRNGPVMYCFSPSIRPAIGSYVFSGDFSSEDCIKVSARYLRDRGLRKIAVLSATDATGQDADRAVDEIVQSRDYASLSIVAREHFNLGDISVRAQLARLKAAAPQALISYTSGPAFATVLRAMLEEGLDIPVVSSPANMSYSQLDQYKSFMPAELLFPGHAWFTPEYVTISPWRQSIVTFTDAIRAAGLRPDKIQAGAWDIGMLIVESLRRVGPNAPADKVRDDINNLRGWYGVLGRYDFRGVPNRGLAAPSIPMDRWDPAKSEFVAVSKPGGEPLK